MLTVYETEKQKHEIKLAARCIKPCFKNLNTSMVSETEGDCMTNCIAKGMDVVTQF